MKATVALLLAAFTAVCAVPTPDGWSETHEGDSCKDHEICKDKDWSKCAGWKPHHRRSGWDDNLDHCEYYDKCKNYDWHACKPKDEWKDEKKGKKHDGDWSFPFHFTSTLEAYAGPDQVVNNSNVAVLGLEKGYGHFKFGLNSHEDVICYNISVFIKGDYQSPAKTATHIHQAPKGKAGPPRIAFPNPEPRHGESWDDYAWRYSFGCLWGPFETGIVTDGVDTGSAFKVKQLEDAPWEFFADTHTAEFPAGAIRGQIYDV